MLNRSWIVLAALASSPSPASALPAQGLSLEPPDVALLDQTGAPRLFASEVLGDDVAALDFVFTRCGTICPALSALFSKAQERLGARLGRGVKLVTLSLDPEHDTPEVLRRYAERHGAGEGWRWLTGSPENVEAALRAMGAWSGDF